MLAIESKEYTVCSLFGLSAAFYRLLVWELASPLPQKKTPCLTGALHRNNLNVGSIPLHQELTRWLLHTFIRCHHTITAKKGFQLSLCILSYTWDMMVRFCSIFLITAGVLLCKKVVNWCFSIPIKHPDEGFSEQSMVTMKWEHCQQ